MIRYFTFFFSYLLFKSHCTFHWSHASVWMSHLENTLTIVTCSWWLLHLRVHSWSISSYESTIVNLVAGSPPWSEAFTEVGVADRCVHLALHVFPVESIPELVSTSSQRWAVRVRGYGSLSNCGSKCRERFQGDWKLWLMKMHPVPVVHVCLDKDWWSFCNQ